MASPRIGPARARSHHQPTANKGPRTREELSAGLLLALGRERTCRRLNSSWSRRHASRPPTSCAIRGAKSRGFGPFYTRTALFFCACVGMSLKTKQNKSRSKKFAPRSWSCSATARGSPAARTGDTGAHTTPALDFFRAISAGECLASSKHCGPVWRQAQLTDAIRHSSAAVVENYYVAHLACCLMQ